jgi:arginine exporter protein ArgO
MPDVVDRLLIGFMVQLIVLCIIGTTLLCIAMPIHIIERIVMWFGFQYIVYWMFTQVVESKYYE